MPPLPPTPTPPPPPIVPPAPESTFTPPVFVPPTPKQQSWGTIVSIIIIVLMIVIGAFYTWGQKLAQERAIVEQLTGTTTAP